MLGVAPLISRSRYAARERGALLPDCGTLRQASLEERGGCRGTANTAVSLSRVSEFSRRYFLRVRSLPNGLKSGEQTGFEARERSFEQTKHRISAAAASSCFAGANHICLHTFVLTHGGWMTAGTPPHTHTPPVYLGQLLLRVPRGEAPGLQQEVG